LENEEVKKIIKMQTKLREVKKRINEYLEDDDEWMNRIGFKENVNNKMICYIFYIS